MIFRFWCSPAAIFEKVALRKTMQMNLYLRFEKPSL